MKYCLNSNLQSNLLEKADEIAITKEDFGSLYEIAERYPNAKLIIPEPIDADDWDDFIKTYKAMPDRVIAEVSHAATIELCNAHSIPFFYKYGVATFSELRALKDKGAVYAVVAPPLSFQLDKVKGVGLPVRLCPNRGGLLGLLSPNPIHDTWILPKEIDMYEDYVDTLYFSGGGPQAEAALFKIYSQDKCWLAPLDKVIRDFPESRFEAGFVEPMAPRRIKCGQTCEIDGRCHFCDRAVDVADGKVMAYYNAPKDRS